MEGAQDLESIVVDRFIKLFRKTFKYDGSSKVQDKFEDVGINIMKNSILHWIKQEKPIHCCLPAFPVKSPSQNKVLNIFPDFGEYLALKKLYEFAKNVSLFYKYGCQILIISDGRVYGDLIGVDIKNIIIYHNELVNMINKNKFNLYINYTNLANELNLKNDHLKIIDIFLKQFGENNELEQISKNIKNDKNVQKVCYGMSRFLEYDCAPWDINKYSSIKSVKKQCKSVAVQMMIRSKAYSKLIKANYPNHLRFSIHGHDNSNKFAVCLYKQYNIKYCITPWHNVICQMLDGRIIIIKHIIIKYIININKLRDTLDTRNNSKCNIFSISKNKWYDDGVIHQICCDTLNNEWLLVKYCNNKKSKRIQRYSPYLFPKKVKNLNQSTHPLDNKHNEEFKKIAINFTEWSNNTNSAKSFKLIYNNQRKWCYKEISYSFSVPIKEMN